MGSAVLQLFGVWWASVGWFTPSSWFGVCEYKPHTSPSSRTGCFIVCYPSRRTPCWLYRRSRLAPTCAGPCMALERRRCCCSSSAFITPGMPSRTTFLSRRRTTRKLSGVAEQAIDAPEQHCSRSELCPSDAFLFPCRIVDGYQFRPETFLSRLRPFHYAERVLR